MIEACTDADTEAAIARAASALRAGGLVVFPTETQYGIGCNALDAAALARLCRAKRRPEERGMGLIIGDAAMLEAVADELSSRARRLMTSFWPGPLTLLLPARADLPPAVVVAGRVAVRLSSDPTAAALARALGAPIAAPSANLSGEPPARDVNAARRSFGAEVEIYLDGGTIEGPPSTFVDPGPPLRVLREGVIPAAAIDAVLRA